MIGVMKFVIATSTVLLFLCQSAISHAQTDTHAPHFDAFAALKLGYVSGVYTEESDLLRIVQYHSFYGMPHEAAKILAAELNAGRIKQTAGRYIQLSDLYRLAREDDLAAKAMKKSEGLGGVTRAATIYGGPSLTPTGKLYFEGQCKKIEGYFSEKKYGSERERSTDFMLLGICYYELSVKEKTDALCEKYTDKALEQSAWFQTLQDSKRIFSKILIPSSERMKARKWVGFIDAEYQDVKGKCAVENR